MALGHNPSIVRSGLVFCVDAANPKSRLGSNLLTELTSVSNFPANQNVTVTRLSRGEILAVTNQNTSSPGVWPIGGTISVSANTQYTLRVNGTVISGSAPFLYVNGTTTGDVVWTGNPLTTSGGYVENTFNTGSNTSVRVGVLWNSPTLGSTFTISDIGLFRTDRWYDLSGNGNNANIEGSPTFSTDKGGRWSVDSVGTNWFNLDSKAGLINVIEGTVGGWVRFNSISSNNYVFLSYGGNGSGGGFLLQSESGTTTKFEMVTFGNSISGGRASLGETLSTPYVGTDMYMIATYNTSVVKLYLNGIEVSSSNKNSNSLPSQSYLRISSEFDRSRGVGGYVYNVQIYNRALTAAEIAQNFNAQRDRYGI